MWTTTASDTNGISSEDFCAKMDPEIAIISVWSNSHGHPRRTTVENFQAVVEPEGERILRLYPGDSGDPNWAPETMAYCHTTNRHIYVYTNGLTYTVDTVDRAGGNDITEPGLSGHPTDELGYQIFITEVAVDANDPCGYDWVELYMNWGSIDLASVYMTDHDDVFQVGNNGNLNMNQGDLLIIHDSSGVSENDVSGKGVNGLWDIYQDLLDLASDDDQFIITAENSTNPSLENIVDIVCWSNDDGTMSPGEVSDGNDLISKSHWGDPTTGQGVFATDNQSPAIGDVDNGYLRRSILIDNNDVTDWEVSAGHSYGSPPPTPIPTSTPLPTPSVTPSAPPTPSVTPSPSSTPPPSPTPEGYHTPSPTPTPPGQFFGEGFKNGLPVSWTVIDGYADGFTWRDDNPGGRVNANWSPPFMIVDSDNAGYTVDMDEELISLPIDCSGYENVHLYFSHDFNKYQSEIADVDVRIDEGAWNNVTRYTGKDTSGLVVVDVSSIADNQSSFQIRWHYYNAKYEWWWGIDNVSLRGDLIYFATPSPTPEGYHTPTATPTIAPIPTLTPGPTATPIPSLTPGPNTTPIPSLTPESTATPIPTATPKPSATPPPSSSPSASPSPTATSKPSATPTPTPPYSDTPTPTPLPTAHCPLPILDFNGDGTSDFAVFRPTSGLWAIRGITRVYFGGASDQTVPGDYNGDGTTDIGIFRGSSGLWAIRAVTRAYFGSGNDFPIQGDYDGDGTYGIGIFRATSGLWAIRGITRTYFGTTGDEPVPGYYSGAAARNIGIFRGSSGLWAIKGLTRVYFGSSIDETVPGDYDGSGHWSVGIFRPSSGLWAVRGVTRSYFGSAIDRPVPADYAGNHSDSIGIFRGTSGLWAVRGVTRVYFGMSKDIPIAR